MADETADVRYPLGKFHVQPYSDELRIKMIRDIKFLPTDLELAIQNLDEHQYETPYRDGGWTVKQLVHHIADSHMHAYIRFKLAVTENNPVIKPYEEKEWVKLNDVEVVPVNVSVTLLHALHRRWHVFLENLVEKDFINKTVYHPEQKREMSLWMLLCLYSWHGRHHVAHINALKERMDW
jgi:uncharacterized damage-inducible protein DinB